MNYNNNLFDITYSGRSGAYRRCLLVATTGRHLVNCSGPRGVRSPAMVTPAVPLRDVERLTVLV